MARTMTNRKFDLTTFYLSENQINRPSSVKEMMKTKKKQKKKILGKNDWWPKTNEP